MRILLETSLALILIVQCCSFSFQEDWNLPEMEEQRRENFADVEEFKRNRYDESDILLTVSHTMGKEASK